MVYNTPNLIENKYLFLKMTTNEKFSELTSTNDCLVLELRIPNLTGVLETWTLITALTIT